LREQEDRLISQFSIAVNFPLSELTSQPVADTATQEEMALSSGQSASADILKILQHHYARIVHGSFRLVAAAYSPEALGEVAGAQFVEAVTGIPMADLPPEQQALGLKAYAGLLRYGPLKDEMPVVLFGATSKDNDPRRVEQLFKFVPLAAQAGLDVMPVVQEIGRALGIGDLQPMALMPGQAPGQQPPTTETGNGEREKDVPDAGGPGAAQMRARGQPAMGG
jgi:hypothetical protein